MRFRQKAKCYRLSWQIVLNVSIPTYVHICILRCKRKIIIMHYFYISVSLLMLSFEYRIFPWTKIYSISKQIAVLLTTRSVIKKWSSLFILCMYVRVPCMGARARVRMWINYLRCKTRATWINVHRRVEREREGETVCSLLALLHPSATSRFVSVILRDIFYINLV